MRLTGLDFIGAEKPRTVSDPVPLPLFIGSVLGAVALAYLWRAHWIIGGLLGFFIVGPVVVGVALDTVYTLRHNGSSL